MQPLRIEVIDRVSAAILAAKIPAEKVAMVAESWRTARLLAEAGARYLHPDWSDLQIQQEVARRMMHGAG